ncbi:hypothetical protein [Litoribacillus peritrichatus]|uniref:Bacteriocin immunity protein n=1 Tax=Litoribacillus peritrichatus TaxID=718191 RepID=A0ABP7MZN0_9GAMM
MHKLNKEELIALVQKIMDCTGSEEEQNEDLYLLQNNVPHPEVTDLIFWHRPELSAEEVVEKALSYKPIQL